MTEEWSEWIEHNGEAMPVPSSAIVAVSFRVPAQPGDRCSGNPDEDRADTWMWDHEDLDDDIVRYRVKRPRALLQLIEMVENLPAPAQPRVDA